jgi:hypothetical protein
VWFIVDAVCSIQQRDDGDGDGNGGWGWGGDG